jgi:phage head maturation protease
MNDRELRCYSGEVRAEQQSDQPTRIIGYGSVFNSRSEPLWGFREIIKPGAFDDVLTTTCADCLTMTRISFLGAARRERYR